MDIRTTIRELIFQGKIDETIEKVNSLDKKARSFPSLFLFLFLVSTDFRRRQETLVWASALEVT